MKKLLLVSTAIAGVAMMSAPASAAVKLDLGGFFRGYGVYADNNEATGDANSLYKFEFRRDTEIQANGETTLDNGLTIGAHTELKIGNGNNGVLADEEYGYASGGWGRFNLGVEDGAAYLLQVNAPSADSNVDGMRVNIQGINTKPGTASANGAAALAGASGSSAAFNSGKVEYAQSDFGGAGFGTDRLTFLTPKFNGFQGGVSYAPKTGFTSNTGGMSNDKNALAFADPNTGAFTTGIYKNLWEASGRYDGEFEGFGFGLGAGYSDSTLGEKATTAQAAALTANQYYLDDGIKSWNAGLNIAAQGFSLGGAYKHTLTSRTAETLTGGGAGDVATGDIVAKTWVIGGAYDNGPYHVGASWLKTDTKLDAIAVGANANNIAANQQDITKYAVGGGYTFGPGMTFRGAVAWGKFDDKVPAPATDSNKFTQVTVGTDIQF